MGLRRQRLKREKGGAVNNLGGTLDDLHSNEVSGETVKYARRLFKARSHFLC